ncbi:MAG: substrate-binding domain-containing protein [Treponema sp.]
MKIAVYVNNLDEEYQLATYRSISDRAKELGIDLLCIQQERLDDLNSSLLNFPSLRFISVDGAILLSSVLMDEQSYFYGKELNSIFGNLPVISLGAAIAGIPSLIPKSQDSLETLMDHLLNVHHYEHFIFLGGTENHQDNIERESVFKQSIKKAHESNPSITSVILHANFNSYLGMNVISQYIEQNPHAPADVIVSANDSMAFGAIKVIKTQQNERWAKCAVTGFDDVPDARFIQPSLTTIRQPTQEMGSLAVETIYKLAKKQKVEKLITVDSSFIIRNSCGCTTEGDTLPTKQSSNSELKDYITQMQKNQINADRIQQHASYFGHLLNGVTSVYQIINHLKSFLGDTGISVFYLILFDHDEKSIPDSASLFYSKVGKEIVYKPCKKIILKDFFSTELCSSNNASQNFILHYLNVDKKQIGMIIYQSENSVLPQMCSISILLSNTINRIHFLQKEKERSLELEKEVEKRTNEIVQANKKLEEESQRRIKVEAEVLKISEQERMRFSMDLHDDICQRLAGISMMCKGMSAMQPDLQDLSTLIDETLHRTRQYAHDSFPMELDSLGMNEAIGNLCNTVETQSENKLTVKYKWNAEPQLPLDRAQKINVFRIIQEALHNTIKHAKATQINVTVGQNKNQIKITVKDNGKGSTLLNKDPTLTDFQSSTKGGSLKSVGIGLRSMYYRADQIGAKCSIHSEVEKGTSVTVIIPIK